MKILFISLFLTISFTAFGTVPAYTCKTRSFKSYFFLKKEKALTFHKGVLQVSPETCSVTQNEKYNEICSIGDHTLMVSSTGLPSVLVTSKGAIHQLTCTPEQQQQQQQQEQQQEETEDEPGHGGNTIGNGGGNH